MNTKNIHCSKTSVIITLKTIHFNIRLKRMVSYHWSVAFKQEFNYQIGQPVQKFMAITCSKNAIKMWQFHQHFFTLPYKFQNINFSCNKLLDATGRIYCKKFEFSAVSISVKILSLFLRNNSDWVFFHAFFPFRSPQIQNHVI